MRHFAQLDASTVGELFHIPPSEFTCDDPADRLATGLGATLYLPAVRPELAGDIARCHAAGVMSMVCCLEDAIRDCEVSAAVKHLIVQLRRLAAARQSDSGADGPLLFVRVREADQIYRIADGLGPALGVLTGFVLPKFEPGDRGGAQLVAVREVVSQAVGHRLYAMPILESPAVAHAESRLETLLATRDLLEDNRETVLAVRVGGTDLSGVFGLRRGADVTAWDLAVLCDILVDILNVFTRHDGMGFAVTGPVMEYFRGIDAGTTDATGNALVRETRRDMANGMLGKTIIHPCQAPIVHALAVVSHEEYLDAAAICMESDGTGGVLRSAYRNKMNEVRPHLAWAGRMLQRAAVFGVAAEGVGLADLLKACTTANTTTGGADHPSGPVVGVAERSAA